LVKKILDYFEPKKSGGYNQGDKIEDNNMLVANNVIRYKPAGRNETFYTVTIDGTGNKGLTPCGDNIPVDPKYAKYLFTTGNLIFENGCPAGLPAKKVDFEDYFYTEILLGILIDDKTEFLNCLRVKLSPTINDVLEKLSSSKEIKFDNSPRVYNETDDDVIKLIKSVVEKIKNLKNTDSEPFIGILEPFFKLKIDQKEVGESS